MQPLQQSEAFGRCLDLLAVIAAVNLVLFAQTKGCANVDQQQQDPAGYEGYQLAAAAAQTFTPATSASAQVTERSWLGTAQHWFCDS